MMFQGAKIRCFVFFASIAVMFVLSSSPTFGCSYAFHQWEPIYHKTFHTETPVIPFAEADLLLKSDFLPVKYILWVTPKADSLFTRLTAFLMPYYHYLLFESNLYDYVLRNSEAKPYPQHRDRLKWCKDLTWIPIKNGRELKEKIKELEAENCIVIGSDKASLKYVVYADKLSQNICKQVVIFQKDRIRAVQNSSHKSFATETNGVAYSSFIYYKWPVLSSFMNISLYPVTGIRAYFLQNEELAVKLIDQDLLKPMLRVQQDPSTNNIPELPDD